MKKILVIPFVFALAACGSIDKKVADYTGYSKTCIDGVSYIQFPSGASVQYDQTGKVITC